MRRRRVKLAVGERDTGDGELQLAAAPLARGEHPRDEGEVRPGDNERPGGVEKRYRVGCV
jgi:hypothetical protein